MRLAREHFKGRLPEMNGFLPLLAIFVGISTRLQKQTAFVRQFTLRVDANRYNIRVLGTSNRPSDDASAKYDLPRLFDVDKDGRPTAFLKGADAQGRDNKQPIEFIPIEHGNEVFSEFLESFTMMKAGQSFIDCYYYSDDITGLEYFVIVDVDLVV